MNGTRWGGDGGGTEGHAVIGIDSEDETEGRYSGLEVTDGMLVLGLSSRLISARGTIRIHVTSGIIAATEVAARSLN